MVQDRSVDSNEVISRYQENVRMLLSTSPGIIKSITQELTERFKSILSKVLAALLRDMVDVLFGVRRTE